MKPDRKHRAAADSVMADVVGMADKADVVDKVDVAETVASAGSLAGENQHCCQAFAQRRELWRGNKSN